MESLYYKQTKQLISISNKHKYYNQNPLKTYFKLNYTRTASKKCSMCQSNILFPCDIRYYRQVHHVMCASAVNQYVFSRIILGIHL